MRTTKAACAMALMALLMLAGCLQTGAPNPFGRGTLLLERQNTTLQVELASTPAQTERGMMRRTSLDEDKGMLFDMGSTATQSFWMYNTLIPLDAIFFDEQMRVVDIQTMEPCGQTDPARCPLYVSRAPARYVLEVNAGFSERHDVREGDRMRLGG